MPADKSVVPDEPAGQFPDCTEYLRSEDVRWKSYAHGSDGYVRFPAATAPEKDHPVEQKELSGKRFSDASIFADNEYRRDLLCQDQPAVRSETNLRVRSDG